MPVIGFLSPYSSDGHGERLRAFRQGLAETGYVDGVSVAIEYRWAENQFDRLPAMTADLIGRKVAVLFVSPDVAVRTAMSATKTIPIVFVTASDPVAAGFVPSLGRPGGNVTGITMLGVELLAKRLELLHELLPGATRIALLVNPNNPDLHGSRDCTLDLAFGPSLENDNLEPEAARRGLRVLDDVLRDCGSNPGSTCAMPARSSVPWPHSRAPRMGV
jgi:hypothetical protein